MDKLSKLDAVSKVIEAYGVGVRAGILTPCLEDENAFRKMLGLNPAPNTVVDAWAAQGGTRAPITLQQPKAIETASTAQPQPADGAEPPTKKDSAK